MRELFTLTRHTTSFPLLSEIRLPFLTIFFFKVQEKKKELPCPLEFSLKATRRTFNQIKLFRVEERKSRLKKKLLKWQVAQSYLIEGKQNFYILKKEDVDYNLEPIYKLVEVSSMYFGKFGLKIFAAVCILDVN